MVNRHAISTAELAKITIAQTFLFSSACPQGFAKFAPWTSCDTEWKI
jgi:hypothetical protein